jgi:hypothetical protein
MKTTKKVTVVIGQRGGGQVLGAFTNRAKIKELKQLAEKFHEKGYVVFETVTLNEFQKNKFGLYFK